MKKKITLMFAFIFGLFCLVSCGGNNNSNNNDKPNTDDTGNNNPGNTDKPEENDNYEVKVLYFDGTPAKSDTKIKVQVCTATGCQFPVAIDDTGVAVLEGLADDTYYIHLQNVPTGYTYNPNLTIDSTNKKANIYLYEITTPTTGDGTSQAPYVAGLGVYRVTCSKAKEFTFFEFTPTKAGTYIFESLIQTVQSGTVLIPALQDMENNKSSEFEENKNIAYTLNAEAGKKYVFAFTLMDGTIFPEGKTVSYDFIITEML